MHESDSELAAKIVKAAEALTKKRMQDIRRDFQAEWQVACLFDCDWFDVNALKPRGRAALEKLAAELGVS